MVVVLHQLGLGFPTLSLPALWLSLVVVPSEMGTHDADRSKLAWHKDQSCETSWGQLLFVFSFSSPVFTQPQVKHTLASTTTPTFSYRGPKDPEDFIQRLQATRRP